ncbi:MAG: hypothetical protein ACRDN0_36230 [Trebonia sp.]
MSIRLTTGGYLGDAELDDLRTKAQDFAQAEDWAGLLALLALRERLEQDTIFWTDLWGGPAKVRPKATMSGS